MIFFHSTRNELIKIALKPRSYLGLAAITGLVGIILFALVADGMTVISFVTASFEQTLLTSSIAEISAKSFPFFGPSEKMIKLYCCKKLRIFFLIIHFILFSFATYSGMCIGVKTYYI